MINLFGKGFVGNRFSQLYACIVNERNNFVPNLKNVTDIFYTIGAISNYNVLTNPYLDIETNLLLLIKTLENFKKDPRSKDVVFNFASTYFVYGRNTLPLTENLLCDPTGFYSITKRTAEQLLISYCQTFDLKYRILRFSNILGVEDQKTSLKKNAVTQIIKLMKYDQTIDLYANGKHVRDFMHLDDACKAVKIIMENGEVNEIYNIGSGKPCNIKMIIDHVLTLGSKSVINNIEVPKFHKIVQTEELWLDISKIKNLGFIHEYTVEDIIEEIYNKA